MSRLRKIKFRQCNSRARRAALHRAVDEVVLRKARKRAEGRLQV